MHFNVRDDGLAPFQLTQEDLTGTETVIAMILKNTEAVMSLEQRMSAVVRQCLMGTFELPSKAQQAFDFLGFTNGPGAISVHRQLGWRLRFAAHVANRLAAISEVKLHVAQ